MATAQKDQYVNVIKSSITMSAADTLTFDEIQVGLNLFDKVGLLIHRIAYYFPRTVVNELVADTDELGIGLVGSNNVTTIDPDDRWVLDSVGISASASGTPANFIIFTNPIVHDFTEMPGMGLLVPPKPLYLAMDTDHFAAAASAFVNIYFTIKSLKDADYFELLETFRFFD